MYEAAIADLDMAARIAEMNVQEYGKLPAANEPERAENRNGAQRAATRGAEFRAAIAVLRAAQTAETKGHGA